MTTLSAAALEQMIGSRNNLNQDKIANKEWALTTQMKA